MIANIRGFKSPQPHILIKRVHGTFPGAGVQVKPMVTLSSINTHASKAQKAVLAGIVEEMFDDAGNWLGVE